MILQTQCKHCNKTIRFHSFATDRLELSKLERIMNIELKCRHCKIKDKYHINDIHAKSKVLQILALAIFIIGTPITFMLIKDYLLNVRGGYATLTIAGFLLVPITIFMIINKEVQTAQSRFNLSRIKK